MKAGDLVKYIGGMEPEAHPEEIRIAIQQWIDLGNRLPKLGEIFTIREQVMAAGKARYFRFEEIHNPPVKMGDHMIEPPYPAEAFAPVKKPSIEGLRALLDLSVEDAEALMQFDREQEAKHGPPPEEA